MALTIKNEKGEIVAQAIDDQNYVPVYEVEKLKDPTLYNLAEEDRKEKGGLTPDE
jgi:hypothetical protein